MDTERTEPANMPVEINIALPPAAPRRPSLPRDLVSALTDSPYRIAPWSAADALARLRADGLADRLEALLERNRFSVTPCDTKWIVDRLSALMMAHGHERDPVRIAAWLAESARLLADLPHDILAEAIDGAVKASTRGFLPAVGEIRAIADPAFAARRLTIDRLERVVRLQRRGGAPETEARPDYCTAAQAAAIMVEYGLRSGATAGQGAASQAAPAAGGAA
jgi:hypothetical protein